MQGAQIRGIVCRLQGWEKSGWGFLERKNILLKYDVSRNIDTTRIEKRAFVCYKGENEANKHTQKLLIRSHLVGYEKDALRGICYLDDTGSKMIDEICGCKKRIIQKFNRYISMS